MYNIFKKKCKFPDLKFYLEKIIIKSIKKKKLKKYGRYEKTF